MNRTVTQTVTAEAMMKRAVWTPPKGAGPDYVLPQLILFPANVIKQACECLVTPPVNTVTKTATATATVSADTKTPTVTKTVATKTNTVTMTATNVATTTANPTTTTRTETVTTTNMPVPTSVNCENRAVPQTRVRGSINSDPISFTVSEQSAASAEDCFSICRTQQPQAVSFAFAQFNTVGCFCYNSMICNIVTPAPNGNLVGGDLAVQFMQG
ncbi:MAG: hypothetical protein LQ345_005122 [Seirophora villosa]|nr:MAG: hypothetical protein LQ345_005122 [Seirophora villosa]